MESGRRSRRDQLEDAIKRFGPIRFIIRTAFFSFIVGAAGSFELLSNLEWPAHLWLRFIGACLLLASGVGLLGAIAAGIAVMILRSHSNTV
jgi:hypothetical protein